MKLNTIIQTMTNVYPFCINNNDKLSNNINFHQMLMEEQQQEKSESLNRKMP